MNLILASRREVCRIGVALGALGFAAILVCTGMAATPAAVGPSYNDITFFIGSDLHYGYADSVTVSSNIAQAALDRMNALPGEPYPDAAGGGTVGTPRGVLLIGDLTDTGALPDWMAFTNDFGLNGERRLGFPVYEAFGNHDLNWPVLYGVRARTPSRTGVSNISTNGYHYSWDWDSLHLVCLNLFPGDFRDDSFDPYGSLTFLADDLARNVGSSGRPVIIYHHFGFDYFSLSWWSDRQRTNYFEAIKNYNVIAIFAGHYHFVDYVPWCGLATFNDGTMGKSLGNFLVAHLAGTKLTVVERTADGAWGALFSQSISVSNTPTIVSGPQPVSAPAGSSVTLSVRAIGPALTYQWFFQDTNAIPGATNSTLALTNLSFQQSGNYSVAVVNPAGTAATPATLLTVVAKLVASPALVLAVSGQPAAPLDLEYSYTLFPTADWSPLTTVTPLDDSLIYLELALDHPQGFYRTTPPAIAFQVGLVPAVTVLGAPGTLQRLEYQNVFDPSNTWRPLAILNLTSAPQRYLDTSAFGQPRRSYRVVGIP
jgi:hypothetical protein